MSSVFLPLSDRRRGERTSAGAPSGAEQPVPHAAPLPPPRQDQGGGHARHGQPRKVGDGNVHMMSNLNKL